MPERSSPFLVEPEQVRTLLTLIDRKTFSAAAVSLGVQQSAISHQIRRMEDRLGRKLFRRTSAGVEVTPDGEALVIYAHAMLKLDLDLRRQFQEPREAITLRIGIVDDLNRTALPKVLWLFSRDYPNFGFRIESGRPNGFVKQLEEGQLDLALVRHRGDLVHAEPAWTDPLVWVGRPDTSLPVRDPIPLVLPAAPSALRDLVLRSLQEAGRSWHVPFEGVGLASLEAGLCAGLGIGAFPGSMERVGTVELGDDAGLPDLPHMHYAVLRAPAPISDGAEAFCQVFKNAARLSFRTEPVISPEPG